ncbi:MAG: methyltransferase [Candidatus Margulisiibacteriota bacterium]
MQIQWLVLGLFALNMLICWLTLLSKKFQWYQFIAGLIFIVLPLLTVFTDQPRFELDFYWWNIAGFVAIALGLVVSLWARVEFIKAGVKLEVLPDKLITSGPYQFVRHPQFLGLVFIWVGWWWVWSAVYAFYFGMFILALTWLEALLEEKLVFEKQFGQQYRDYKAQTGMFWIK